MSAAKPPIENPASSPVSNRATRFLRALRREPTDCTPVWLMRQAGRYLPEYNRVRAEAGDFLALCQSPARACEVTLQPLERFELDAAILFSDILTIPDAMGLGLRFAVGEGPWFEHPVRHEEDIARLAVPDPHAELKYVIDAVSTIRQALAGKVPLIGFSGSPWTLACYMVEGRGSSDFRHIKSLRYGRPDLMHRLLTVTADAVTVYLKAQAAAGAQALMLFDTWGGILSDSDFPVFSQGYLKQIITALKADPATAAVPVIVFTKGGGLWLERLADTGATGVGVDWTVDLASARQRIGNRVAIQGNLDPMTLMGPPSVVRDQAAATIDRYDLDSHLASGLGHIFNLGHGISQFTPPDNVTVLVDTVHEHSRKRRQEQASRASSS